MQNIYPIYAMLVAILPFFIVIPIIIALFLIVKNLKEINQSLKEIVKSKSNE